MNFKKNDKIIDFEEFSAAFVDESEIIKEFLDLDYTIQIEGSRLSLVYGSYSPVFIDVAAKLLYHKQYFYKNSLYKEPLARAIGLKRGEPKPSVLDATAGFLGDSLLLFSMGVDNLTLAERNPISSLLISNALSEAQLEIPLFCSDSRQIESEFDVIYFDPMYAHTSNKKAAAKKQMIIFRDVVGEDLDSECVARSLFDKAFNRLVIKRSIKAPFLIGEPSFSISGKSTRYDVYLKI